MEKGKRKKKKRTLFGRTAQPELPRVDVFFELPEAEVKEKNLLKMEGQFEISECITLVPPKFQLEIHKRQKYRQKGDSEDEAHLEAPERILTAPGAVNSKKAPDILLSLA